MCGRRRLRSRYHTEDWHRLQCQQENFQYRWKGPGHHHTGMTHGANVTGKEEAANEGERRIPRIHGMLEFSTAGISTDRLSMQISVQGGRARAGSPDIPGAESRMVDGAESCRCIKVAEDRRVPGARLPDMEQLSRMAAPAFKQIISCLLRCLGHEHVYVRLTPVSKAASTSYGWNAGEITQSLTRSRKRHGLFRHPLQQVVITISISQKNEIKILY